MHSAFSKVLRSMLTFTSQGPCILFCSCIRVIGQTNDVSLRVFIWEHTLLVKVTNPPMPDCLFRVNQERLSQAQLKGKKAQKANISPACSWRQDVHLHTYQLANIALTANAAVAWFKIHVNVQ